MSHFPSSPIELAFAASHQYASHGASEMSKYSWRVVRSLKQDGFLERETGEPRFVNVLEKMTETAACLITENPFMAKIFTDRSLLVPVPGHSLVRDANSVWPAARICAEIGRRGIGAGACPLLQRVTSVRKAAFAPSTERPTPGEHYDSTIVAQAPLKSFDAITLVDDVVTRGSTFIGMSEKLKESFPGVPIFCFALVRTISSGDVTKMICPVNGTITYRDGKLVRDP